MMTEVRRQLIDALRDPPANFQWRYDLFYAPIKIPETPEQEKFCGFCGCAMGLVRHLNLIEMSDWRWNGDRDAMLSKALGMSFGDVARTFYDASNYGKIHRADVTPQEVADHLESLP